MIAFRKTVKVKNHFFKITLPNDFITDEVDLIILLIEPNYYQVSHVRLIKLESDMKNI